MSRENGVSLGLMVTLMAYVSYRDCISEVHHKVQLSTVEVDSTSVLYRCISNGLLIGSVHNSINI